MTGDTPLARALVVNRCGADALAGSASRVGEIYVMLTWDCNLRCRMCPFWGSRGLCHTVGTGDEGLDVERLADWIPVGTAGPRTVTLSGGEPLLAPGWSALARTLVRRGVRVALTTNATGLAEVADFVVDRGVPLLDLFTHRFTLGQAVEAYRLFDSGRTGKVVFTWQ